jgi:Holliday junction resolvase-like predicted endonuclease
MQATYPSSAASLIQEIDAGFWDSNIAFWPYDVEGEIDVLLEFPEHIIGIEVKYWSGLSSDDDTGQSATWESSRNQLARESRILSRKRQQNKLLLFIAPELDCLRVFEASRERIHPDVAFACASWNDILLALRTVQTDNPYEQLILADLERLLIHKGFEKFRSFDCYVDVAIDPNQAYSFDTAPFSFRQIPNNQIWKDDFYVFGN